MFMSSAVNWLRNSCQSDSGRPADEPVIEALQLRARLLSKTPYLSADRCDASLGGGMHRVCSVDSPAITPRGLGSMATGILTVSHVNLVR